MIKVSESQWIAGTPSFREPRQIANEAKAATGWTKKQTLSKAKRLRGIFGTDEEGMMSQVVIIPDVDRPLEWDDLIWSGASEYWDRRAERLEIHKRYRRRNLFESGSKIWTHERFTGCHAFPHALLNGGKTGMIGWNGADVADPREPQFIDGLFADPGQFIDRVIGFLRMAGPVERALIRDIAMRPGIYCWYFITLKYLPHPLQIPGQFIRHIGPGFARDIHMVK